MMTKGFDGNALDGMIKQLPGGAPRMAALQDAIRQADAAGDDVWRLLFRYGYACEATFRDDPPKAMPAAAEFASIFEEHPGALGADGHEMYLMITQMAIDPVVYLPQIPISQWERLMERFYSLVRRYNLGLRTYWWQMCRFYVYVDPEKAFSYFQKFWKTGRDGLSDCRACERSYAVRMSLLAGDRAAADGYAKPMEQGRIRFCNDTPQLMWLAYLEDALDRGGLEEAVPLANALYRKGARDKGDLSYIGAVLRCWAWSDPERAVELVERHLGWTVGLWDQKKVYDFYKGAWVCFRQLAQKKQSVLLELPQSFPFWREDGAYRPKELADWFYREAAGIAGKFDNRNGSDCFGRDLFTKALGGRAKEE